MSGSRALVVVLLLLAIAAAAWWAFADGTLERPVAPGAPADTADGGAVGRSPEVERGAVPVGEAAEAPEGSARTELEVAGAAGAGALVGVIVDDTGAPIAGAQVSAMGGAAAEWGGFGGGPGDGNFPVDFDPTNGADPAELFDPEQWQERLRQAQRDRATTTTDADGRFRLAVAAGSRRVLLRAQARGFAVLSRPAAAPKDADVDLGRLELARAAIVAGRVVDASGRAVAGARVRRSSGMEDRWMQGMEFEVPGMDALESMQDPDVAVTDDGGRFELQHVEPGEFSLRARHPEHPTARREGLSIAAGQTLPDVLVSMPAAASIAGRVIGAPADASKLRVVATSRAPAADPTGGALAGFGIGADMIEEFTGGFGFGEREVAPAADGSFEIAGLHASRSYRVFLVQTGRGFAGRTTCSDRVETRAGRNGLELRYLAGVTVTLRAVDAASGAPVERLAAQHRLRGGERGPMDMILGGLGAGPTRLRNHPDGLVTIANLRPGEGQTLTLTIDALGYRRFERDSIPLPQEAVLDLGEVRLDPQPVVTIVVRGPDGAPIAGANVELDVEGENGPRGNPFGGGNRGDGGNMFGGMFGGGDPLRRGRTDAAGECVLNSQPGASARISVDARRMAPYRSESLTLPATALRHEAELVRGGTVLVRVVASDGSRPATGTVERQPPFGGRDRRRAGEDGICRFEHLTPGEHRFRIGATGRGFDPAMFGGQRGGAAEAGWVTVAVVDEQTAEVRLQQAAESSLSGFVRENGVPLAGARVSLVRGPRRDGNDPAEAGEQMIGDLAERFGGGGRGRGQNGRTQDDGSYSLQRLPPGEHRLRITHRDRAMPTEVAIVLVEGPNVFDVLLDATVVRGVVRDPDGRPIADATVRVRSAPEAGGAGGAGNAEAAAARQMIEGMMPGISPGGGGSARTGDDGAFELRGVAAGVRLVVQASGKGFAPADSAPFVLEAGATKNGIEVALGAAGAIEISVRGNAPPFAGVTATWAGDGDAVAPVVRILQRGKAKLDGLRPGTWRVEYRTMNQNAGEPQTVEVVAGRTTTVEF